MRPRMEEIFNRAEQRVVVSCFSSSIHRIQLVLDLAQECGRRVAVMGRSMVSVTEIAHSLGLLEIPDGILLRPQDAMDLPPDKVAVLISGTQGEPMSALARVAVDNHKHISVERGDTVVLSSRIIPGNEKAIFRMIDHMSRRGADVLYGSMNPPLHVSGHASVEEMKLVLNLVRPRYFMPIHGEFRQLSKHARLADHLRFAGAGRNVRHGFGRDPGDRPSRRAQGRAGAGGPGVHRFRLGGRRGAGSGDPRPAGTFPRTASCCRSSPSTGTPEGWRTARNREPRIRAWPRTASEFLESARQVVAKTLESSNQEEKTDWGVMKEKIRADLKRYIVKQTARRPLDHAGDSGSVIGFSAVFRYNRPTRGIR